MTFRSLWRMHHRTGASWPNTDRIALRSAFPPSSTNTIPCYGSRPRSTKSASSAIATVAFWVDPSQQSQWDLHALGGDPKTHDVGAFFQLDLVEHQHRQLGHRPSGQAINSTKAIAGALHKRPGDRGLQPRPGHLLNLRADRLTRARTPANRYRRKHPLQHHATTDHDTRNAHTSTSPPRRCHR